jgi:urease gamma subunit
MKQLEGIFKYAGWLVVVCFLFAASIPVYAGQYESLSPFLIDLKGWQAKPAKGMDMDMGGTKIIQAMRQYTRDGKEADAMVMIGNAMMTQAQGMQSMQMETAEAKVKVTTIDGYQVSIHHSKADSEGTVVVVLPGTGQQGAIFVFHYKGLNEKDGLSTAKNFDWKKIEQQTKKLMQ